MAIKHPLSTEKSSFLIELKIPAYQLKGVFTELSLILGKTTYSRSFIIRSKNNTLSIRTSTNLEYVAYLDNLNRNCQDFEIACLFDDIKELIYGRGEADVLITPTYVEIAQKSYKISLRVVDYQVPTLPQLTFSEEEIETDPIVEGLSLLLKLAPSAAIYQKRVMVLTGNGIAQVRFPSVWIETPCSGLEMPMESGIANIVLGFLRSLEKATITYTDSWTVIQKGISALYIPIKDKISLKSINELTKDFQYIGDFSFKGLQLDAQKLIRALGKSDCKVYLFERSTRVEVMTDTVQFTFSSLEQEERLLDSFTMRLEFLNAILSVLGEEVSVYGKGDYRCIKGAKASVLISSMA